MLAKDGFPYDVYDSTLIQQEDEIEVIQYIRHDGGDPYNKRRRMLAPVGKEYVKKAENLIISAEELRTEEIAIWVRKVGEPKESERVENAQNGPGENSPTNVLRRMIDIAIQS